jgi:OmpA-OmpF porin, OOP family
VRLYSITLVLIGALVTAVLAMASTLAQGPVLIAGLEKASQNALVGTGIRAVFVDRYGWLTRHPMLFGGSALNDTARARAAGAIAALPGVGGVRWQVIRARTALASEAGVPASLHCQQDVEGILKARTIRFAEASASLDPASGEVLDEVAAALAPCLGSIIAVTGHTDAGGDPRGNLALSLARAEAVRASLVGRGIPADGLRAQGLGAERPVEGLEPIDAANRRIEFSVITSVPLQPTPVDTPGPG